MALDIAIDKNGDLILAPNNDVEVRSGQGTVDQRIRVRLRIHGGQWDLDPTNGELGSHLYDALRLPTNKAIETVAFMVRQALEPMDDITLHDVLVTPNPDSAVALDIVILYAMREDAQSTEILTTTLTIGE